ncbi:MAG: SMC family ATPase, partial [Armatimonadota bacterium]|nr:SMC family ATPase [Armatimonadota bacterium]
MRLISLEVENFLKFAQLAVEFPDGLTGIIGPNGSGKSSLVEAIAWALYGPSVSRAKNEGIPFRRQVPCRVQLRMEIGGDEYLVTRELRGTNFAASAKVFVNDILAENGAEKVTQFIEGRLRMDYRAFLVSYFARQKEVDALSSWEARDRKRYMLRMLGLEQCDRAIERARRNAVEHANELRLREAQLPSLEEIKKQQATAKAEVERLRKDLEKANAALSNSEEALKQARSRMQELETARADHERLKGKYNLAAQALMQARADVQD